MTTERCKLCGCIYSAGEKNCPACGGRHIKEHTKIKPSPMWLFPAAFLFFLIRAAFGKALIYIAYAIIALIVWFIFGMALMYFRQAPEERAANRLDRTPAAARLISMQNKYDRSSQNRAGAVVRTGFWGVVGGEKALALSALNEVFKAREQTATFEVKYASGRHCTETVDIGCARYKMLIALPEFEN